MNNNQIIQQIKPNPEGKAIASLILGIISVINVGLCWGSVIWPGSSAIYYYMEIVGLGGGDNFVGVTLLISLIGIILGKMGLKSTKNLAARIGMILCIISLIGLIFLVTVIMWILSAYR